MHYLEDIEDMDHTHDIEDTDYDFYSTVTDKLSDIEQCLDDFVGYLTSQEPDHVYDDYYCDKHNLNWDN
jgi:hypothetical protein